MQVRFQPAGDQAVLVELGDQIDPQINAKIRGLAHTVESQAEQGFGDVILGYCSLLVYYNPLLISYDRTIAQLQEWAEHIKEINLPPSRQIKIPVVYGGKWGPDLEDVAKYHDLTPEEVIRIHSSA